MTFKLKYTNGRKADTSAFPFKAESPTKFAGARTFNPAAAKAENRKRLDDENIGGIDNMINAATGAGGNSGDPAAVRNVNTPGGVGDLKAKVQQKIDQKIEEKTDQEVDKQIAEQTGENV